MAIRLGKDASEAVIARPRGAAVHSIDEQYQAWKYVDLTFYPFFMLILGGVFLFATAVTIGDWSYWADWKDRRWWPLVAPCVILIGPSVVMYVFWRYMKLPLAFTTVAVGFWVAQMISRWANFVSFTHYPMNFVMPEVIIGAAVLVDAVMLITRSFVLTGLIGGFMWGLLFYVASWPVQAPMHMPVEVHGQVVTLADAMGFEYIRTAMPPFTRIIEEGTLRTFGGHVAPVTAFVAGFFSILIFYIFVWVGSQIARPRWADSAP